MSKRRERVPLACLLLVTLSGESFAQHRKCADQLSAGTPCRGQYECMADQMLTLIEHQADFRQPELTGRSVQMEVGSPLNGRARSANPRTIPSTGSRGVAP